MLQVGTDAAAHGFTAPRQPYATLCAVGRPPSGCRIRQKTPAITCTAATNVIDNLCAQAGVTPHIGPTASQATTLVSLVAAERGVAIVPAFTAALQSPGVAYVPLAVSMCWSRP
jgi:DNA-binding transcriptional LysR family regulator